MVFKVFQKLFKSFSLPYMQRKPYVWYISLRSPFSTQCALYSTINYLVQELESICLDWNLLTEKHLSLSYFQMDPGCNKVNFLARRLPIPLPIPPPKKKQLGVLKPNSWTCNSLRFLGMHNLESSQSWGSNTIATLCVLCGVNSASRSDCE
jgi:hypothetical protein